MIGILASLGTSLLVVLVGAWGLVLFVVPGIVALREIVARKAVRL